jgi:hypothetical protein
MTEAGVVSLLAFLLGYAQQWLRGFKWYSDGVTLLASFLLACFGIAWLGGAVMDDWRQFLWSAAQLMMQLLGGTTLATMVAHSPLPTVISPPTFNQYSGGTK